MPPQRLRILLVDTEAEGQVLQAILGKVPRFLFRLGRQDDVSAALRACRDDRFDAILLNAPPDGLSQSIAQIREEAPYLPVLVYADQEDDALAAEAVRQGAQDFLVKGDADGYAIRRALQGAMDRKQASLAQELTGRILDCLNHPGALDRLAADLTALVKHYTGVEAVGIRLRVGEDFPYFVTRGFADEFLATEMVLCPSPAKASSRRPKLACLCGAVLQGRTDPAKPYFTKAGSFWTNDLPRLLPELKRSDPKLDLRGQCANQGYASVALVPIRCGERTLGLLQVNDPRPGSFAAELISFLERVADSIGLAIRRLQVEGELRRERDFTDAVLQTVGALVCVLDTQGRIERFNRACETVTGYTAKEVHGRAIWDLLLPPEVVAEVRAVFEDLRAGQFPNRHENDWLTRDGRHVRIRWASTCLTDDGGQVRHVIATGEPIAADQQAALAGGAYFQASDRSAGKKTRRGA